jgi:15-O-acetyltransferase Tri3
MLSILSQPLVPADYQWKQSRKSPELWQRRALANEAMWLARPKASRDLFLFTSLVLRSPILRSTLKFAAESAWQQLRYEVPELALKGACQREGKAYMQYQTPQTQEDVSEWVERTSAFDWGEQRQDFEDLLEKILKKRGHNAENVFLFSHVQTSAGNFVLVNRVQLMIYVDHQVTDGIGARILLGRYLLLLASSITTSLNPPEFRFNWEESYNNLSAPWICLMNDNQALSGTKYNENALWNQDILGEQMVMLHRLNELPQLL